MLRELSRHFPNKVFYGVDPFIEDGNTIGHNSCTEKGQSMVAQREITERNIAGLKNVKLFTQTSRLFGAQLTDEMISEMNIGTVFVDGDHSYEEARNDCFIAARLLKNGGVIYLDDVGLPSVNQAITEFIEEYKDRITNLGESMGILRLKPE